MSEIKESLAPEILQIQLIGVYKSLPKNEAAISRNNVLAGISDTYPRKFQDDDIEEWAKAGIDYTTRAEFPKLQLELLNRLLSTAQITQASKNYISLIFGYCFWLGVNENWDEEFDAIGVTDGSRKEAGIFSQDPEIRKKIERTFYDMKRISLEDTDGNDPGEQQTIDRLEADIRQQENEFMDLYGEPIISPQSTT